MPISNLDQANQKKYSKELKESLALMKKIRLKSKTKIRKKYKGKLYPIAIELDEKGNKIIRDLRNGDPSSIITEVYRILY